MGHKSISGMSDNKIIVLLCVLLVIFTGLGAALFLIPEAQLPDFSSASDSIGQTGAEIEQAAPQDAAPGDSMSESTAIPELELTARAHADNYLFLVWNRIGCSGYRVYGKYDDKDYILLAEAGSEEDSCLVHLSSCRDYNIRLEAVDSSGNLLAASQTDIRTVASPLFAAIWPNKRLDVYETPYNGRVVGSVEACERLSVLAEYPEDQRFKIRMSDGELGYIDSNYCMINLPDYMGDLCAYSISNSCSSLYTLHEFEIENVSGYVIPGYENVLMTDGTYLVPLLYPTAQRLECAAEAALARGYRLKIYDAYRPKVATQYIYTSTKAVLNRSIPDTSYFGRPVDELTAGSEKLLKDFVSRRGWNFSAFLGNGGSYHNMGTALDLTLEDSSTGREIEMQTRMHDLSVYSTTYSNNAEASILYDIMTAYGLNTIASEWWHFQDDEAQKTLDLEWCKNGVS